MTLYSAADHLDPDRIRQLGVGADRPGELEQSHLRGCSDCHEALTADQVLTVAARSLDAAEHGRSLAPAFSTLLQQPRFAELRQHRRPTIEPVSASQRATGRLSAEILLAQFRLFSPWLIASAVGLAVLSCIAGLTVHDPAAAGRLSAAAVSLLLMLAAAWAAESGGAARLELLRSLPITPRLTYLFRLSGSLVVALVLGLVVSAIGMTRDGPMVSLWLVPGLLAASAAAVVGVRWNVTIGQTVGVLVWLVGSVSRLPSRADDLGPAGLLHADWARSPLALALAVVLFALAVQAVPGQGLTSARR